MFARSQGLLRIESLRAVNQDEVRRTVGSLP